MRKITYLIMIMVVFISISLCLSLSGIAHEKDEAILTFAPEVPPPISRKHPETIKVILETTEIESILKENEEGEPTKYTFWTYNNRVPGPFIRVKQGDTLELTISNSESSSHTHNIDLHAATGPGGGALITFVKPGETKTVRLKMLNTGLYIYHCATPPVPDHVANGMYGLILVEPLEGLPKVDKEFYVVQSEFYTKEDFGFQGLTTYDREKGLEEHPTYIVFNGKYGSLIGEGALQAKVGDKVRIFFGNGGPNLTASFHVIGEIFDRVYREGGMNKIGDKNVQTTLVPPGGSAIVEFMVEVPGTYTLVDHAVFRFEKGAIGQLSIEGDPKPEIYSSME